MERERGRKNKEKRKKEIKREGGKKERREGQNIGYLCITESG